MKTDIKYLLKCEALPMLEEAEFVSWYIKEGKLSYFGDIYIIYL